MSTKIRIGNLPPAGGMAGLTHLSAGGSRWSTPATPPLKGMIRINALPGTDAQRKALHVKPVKKPKPFAPTIRKVAEIVPQNAIPKVKPLH